jgi:hypothetical protein
MTVNSDHSDIRAQNRTGAFPPAGRSLADREQRARERLGALGGEAAVPGAWDWRDVGGASYVTPIEDQGGCGSCVAFGTIATLEAQVRIAAGNPNLDVDLSEAHLWFCYGPSHGAGACPLGGWWPDQAFPGLIAGVVPSTCFPYTDQNQPCNLCAHWNIQLTGISSWQVLPNQAAMKAFIAQTGPMTACFTVYEDFYRYYAGEIYEYNPNTSGNLVGGHCVSIVGFNDDGQYWIAKNSWGPGWGENGYFRIGYGQCGIDAEMWGINGIIKTEPVPEFSTTFMNFGTRYIGLVYPDRTVTLTNTGLAPLVITNISITGISGDPAAFTVDQDTCTGASIAPGRTCTLSVGFDPLGAVAYKAALTFSDNAGDSPQQVLLEGIGHQQRWRS